MSIYQYGNTEVSKEYLLDHGLYLLYRNEDFEVDNEIIALLDVSEFGLPFGRTLVIHRFKGVFFDTRTTKQLMNEFYKINGIGFAFSKALAGLFNFSHYLPFIHLYFAFMPINGGSRRNTDWIALHFIDRLEVTEDKFIHFSTIFGQSFKVKLLRGNIEKRIHDVALLNRASFILMESFVGIGFCELKMSADVSLLKKFDNCRCSKHIVMREKSENFQEILAMIRKFIMINMVLDVIGRDALIKHYVQNLSKLKKLY